MPIRTVSFKASPSYSLRRAAREFGPEAGQPPQQRSKHTGRYVIVALVILALLVAGFAIFSPNFTNVEMWERGIMGISSTQTTAQTNSSATSPLSVSVSTIQGLSSAPLILNGSADVSYPLSYNTLADYALNAINQDRRDFGLAPVTLSPISSAQQHADSMMYYGYFSHVDTQGYKPYMRYTLLGGVGAIEENIAFISWQGTYYTNTGRLEKSISGLENSMMYNDSACCNNGHRDNILNPLHNRVSIGIAYNSSALYFVEDFENYYIDLSVGLSGHEVSMNGTPLTTTVSSSVMAVFYDPIPLPENVSSLNSGPRDYDPGTLVGGVFPPCNIICPYSQAGVTVYASNWRYTSSLVDISFNLAQFVNRYGPGVFTLYLLTGNISNSTTASAITSISIFEG